MVLWFGLAFAGPEDGIARLIADGKLPEAQARCERTEATAAEVEPALREVCAQAMWSRAEQEGTFAGWVRYQTDWAGTSRIPAAKEMEAKVRLDAAVTEADFATWLRTYEGSAHAPEARARHAGAAVAAVTTGEAAVRVARDHAGAAALAGLVVPWFDAFVKLSVDGEALTVRLDPPIELPGATLQAVWAGREGGVLRPWDEVARAHLQAHGTPGPLIDRLARKADGTRFPPCSLPGIELGVHVTYGEAWEFDVQDRPCGGGEPGFIAVKGGAITGLSLQSGVTNVFPVRGDAALPFTQGATRTFVVLPGEPQPGLRVVGVVFAQPFQAARGGQVWMHQSIAGGLPWIVEAGPPDTAIELPASLTGVALPADLGVFAGEGGGSRVERPGDPAHRWLPAGEVRRLSPLLLELLGLHAENPAFARFTLSEVPAGLTGEVLPALDPNGLLQIQQDLAPFAVIAREAWKLSLAAERGIEVMFRGTHQGRPVGGVLDPNADGGVRLHLWSDDGPQQVTAQRVQHEGRTVFVLTGVGGRETLHVDGRGLVRTRAP